jgi:hypothetical protein
MNRLVRLQVVAYPVLVERFHNHGGVQLKCYSIGGEVHVHVKPSFPDVALAQDSNGEACLIAGAEVPCSFPFVYSFHSLDSMPKAEDSTRDFAYELKVVRCVAQAIEQRVGLTVFGFDLIRPRKCSAAPMLLIDVNAFPSFKGVPEAATALRTCMKRATEWSRKCKR